MLEELVRLDELQEPVFKFKRDPRVTPWGGCCDDSASTSCRSS